MALQRTMGLERRQRIGIWSALSRLLISFSSNYLNIVCYAFKNSIENDVVAKIIKYLAVCFLIISKNFYNLNSNKKNWQRSRRKIRRASRPWSPGKKVSGAKGPRKGKGGEDWVLRSSNTVVVILAKVMELKSERSWWKATHSRHFTGKERRRNNSRKGLWVETGVLFYLKRDLSMSKCKWKDSDSGKGWIYRGEEPRYNLRLQRGQEELGSRT